MERIKKFLKVDRKYEINLLFSILCVYTIFIIINDYICFIFKNDANVITYMISFVITFVIGFFLSRKVKIELEKFSIYDILFYAIILGIYLIKFAIPDKAFDSLNYHIYIQEGTFSDNTMYNFFPARWINTFSFPLADRMHYFFRFMLGYRLGNILNVFIVFIIYYQVKRFLSLFIKDYREMLIPVLSLLVVSTEFILQNYITYYIDLICIPFILEILLIIFSRKYSDFNNYIALLSAGIIVAIKVSNALLLIPIGIIYIIGARKTIKITTIVFGIMIAIFPMAVYLLNNYMQTRKSSFPIL